MFSLETVTINWKKIWKLTYKPIYGLLCLLSYWERQYNMAFKGLTSPPIKCQVPLYKVLLPPSQNYMFRLLVFPKLIW